MAAGEVEHDSALEAREVSDVLTQKSKLDRLLLDEIPRVLFELLQLIEHLVADVPRKDGLVHLLVQLLDQADILVGYHLAERFRVESSQNILVHGIELLEEEGLVVINALLQSLPDDGKLLLDQHFQLNAILVTVFFVLVSNLV